MVWYPGAWGGLVQARCGSRLVPEVPGGLVQDQVRFKEGPQTAGSFGVSAR